MIKPSQRLKEIKALDGYIDSQVKQLEKIESQALKVTSTIKADRVNGGRQTKRDDLYIELIGLKEDIQKSIAKAVTQKREFMAMIDRVEDLESQTLLFQYYIEKVDIWQICEQWEFSRKTFYQKIKKANQQLDEILTRNQ
ncbi:DUF1492 domain-containing protein [Streptococcus sp. zg-JUN1979]|uniref:DUF1492 domain-containing protein n=1 Tax=Streptococcus sp. zg-JUN1979 TaxID=3391450 RepID=UPI0039A5547C